MRAFDAEQKFVDRMVFVYSHIKIYPDPICRAQPALSGAPDTATSGQPPRDASPQGMMKSMMETNGLKVQVCAIYLPGKGADASSLLDGVSAAAPDAMGAEIVAPGTTVLSFWETESVRACIADAGTRPLAPAFVPAAAMQAFDHGGPPPKTSGAESAPIPSRQIKTDHLSPPSGGVKHEPTGNPGYGSRTWRGSMISRQAERILRESS